VSNIRNPVDLALTQEFGRESMKFSSKNGYRMEEISHKVFARVRVQEKDTYSFPSAIRSRWLQMIVFKYEYIDRNSKSLTYIKSNAVDLVPARLACHLESDLVIIAPTSVGPDVYRTIPLSNNAHAKHNSS